LTTAPASIKHHQPQHLHPSNIINHSTCIYQTSLATALPFAQHHQPQHCHLLNIINYSIVISTLPSSPIH
jgi:hypothetical protein